MEPWDLAPYYKARWGMTHTLANKTVDSFNSQIISILESHSCSYCIAREVGNTKKAKVHFHLFYELPNGPSPEDSINDLIRETFRKGKSAYMHKQYTFDEINDHSADWYLGYVVKEMNIVKTTYDSTHIENCHNLYKSEKKSTANDLVDFVKAKYYQHTTEYDKDLLIQTILDYHKHHHKIYDFQTILRREFHLCRLIMFESIERKHSLRYTADW